MQWLEHLQELGAIRGFEVKNWGFLQENFQGNSEMNILANLMERLQSTWNEVGVIFVSLCC